MAEEYRHLTTFITPWGRYQYRMAPQGSLASGDGYSRRYDEVIADVERKTKCVDDTAHWDDDLSVHWWRMLDFLELCGRNGIVLNFDKFQFAQREISFAGFRVTESEVQPLDKYIRAISEFPTPKRTVDIRSWFGLVHQVSHYNQLTEMMSPFKPFLSPKTKFEWNAELDRVFEASKIDIINAIKNGVEIFDPTKLTCLRPDWSKQGIGYFLSQKHCDCESSIPGCCEHGWKITLAGSRFLKPAESRYAPVEGEALAIAWSLEHTKFFTQGCDDLIVVTDHKPLVKLFTDRSLDQITNSRLFNLKQRTMPWRFTVKYMAGKENCFSDATSRNPACSSDEEISDSEILAGIMLAEPEVDPPLLLASNDDIRAITWDVVKQETSCDATMRSLCILINSVFPEEKSELPPDLLPFWPVRNNLYVLDGVVLMKDRVVIPETLQGGVTQFLSGGHGARIIIPPNLRQEVIHSLHSAHQGVGGMNERAKASVYWPGITKDIERARASCSSCNRIMPSQARTPPVAPMIPSTPFEAIACDYFHFNGHYYFVGADRLSGWFEVQQIKVGTNDAGTTGLFKALRRLMVTFGVPTEISSDGGPEFKAQETKAFFDRWGIRHRLSSVSFPSSNGRAELAVKTAKRMLMDNISPNGSLDNDAMVRALLAYRNTPEPGCKLSPAQILLGRALRDTLPYMNKEIMVFNNPEVHPQWREAWQAKELAMKARYVKTLETLSEHSRPLPMLNVGDEVMVQNQSGRFPKKWDKSGVIVEVRDHDQYVIKIAGSGRLTLRNRRFVRKFQPHVTQDTRWSHAQIQVAASPKQMLSSLPEDDALLPESSTDLNPLSETEQQSCAPAHITVDQGQLLPSQTPPSSVLQVHDPPVHAQPDVATEKHTRPQRNRKPREVYNSSTGQSVLPQAVPEDI